MTLTTDMQFSKRFENGFIAMIPSPKKCEFSNKIMAVGQLDPEIC